MSSIRIIKPQFQGDRFQVVRVSGYQSSLIAWVTTHKEAREIQRRYQEVERNTPFFKF